MAIKERVLGLLRGPEAIRIRFTVQTTSGPITINRATFATVASAIDAGKIGVIHPNHSIRSRVPSARWSRCPSPRDSCTFPRSWDG